MTTLITNLTPHDVTITRSIPDPTGAPSDRIHTSTTFGRCSPEQLPRAIEGKVYIPSMSLTDGGSDGQAGSANDAALSGWTSDIGYTGVENLPELTAGQRMFGVEQFYIVSLATAIGALACGRGVEDLLVPMGQTRDPAGRINGATSLEPAAVLLSPLYEAIAEPIRKQVMSALIERNAALKECERIGAELADLRANLATQGVTVRG